MEQKTKIKKVQPYPIEAHLLGRATPIVIQIIRLSKIGFLAETKNNILQIHEKWDTEFTLPHFKVVLKPKVVVIKTYDSLPVSPHDKSKRMAELHYLDPDQYLLDNIERFCRAIKQTTGL